MILVGLSVKELHLYYRNVENVIVADQSEFLIMDTIIVLWVGKEPNQSVL